MTTGSIASPAPETTADRRYALRLATLFGLGWVVLNIDIMLLNPLLPLIRSDFQLSGAQAGLITTAFFLPYLLMQVPAGMLADRVEPKRLLVIMTLIGALALGSIGPLATSLAMLVVLAVLHRTCTGVYYPSAFGITLSVVPASLRGVSSAALTGGMALGTTIGLAIAVPLAQFGGSWRFPYLLAGTATLLLPLGILTIVRSGQRVGGGRGRSLGTAVRDPGLWLLFGLGASSNFGFTAVMTWGPSFLHAERGLALAVAGFYTAVISLIGFPAGFLMGRLSDVFGRRPLSVALFLASAVCILAIASLREPLLILIAIAAYGLTGKWAADGPITAWLGDRVTSRYSSAAASVLGLNNAFRMVGAVLAPLVVGALLDLTGSLQVGLYVGAASCLLAALFALLAEDARKPETRV